MTLPWRWRQDATTEEKDVRKMKPLRYVSRDRVAYAIVILYVAAVFVIGRYVPFHIWIF